MPLMTLSIAETEDSFVRPVVMEVARKIMRVTGMPSDTRIYYPGPNEVGLQLGSSIDPGKNGDPVTFNHGNRLSIEVSEEDVGPALMGYNPARPDNPPIFLDRAIDANVRPVYKPITVVISFNFRATDHATAVRWRDQCAAKTSQMRQQFVFDLSYHYPVGSETIKVLEMLHRMRNTIAPYGDEFEEYFLSHCKEGMTKLVNLAGEQATWAMPERTQGVQGWFEFEAQPEEGSRGGTLGTWNIGFTFKFNVDRPASLEVRYPYFVHQQLVDKPYRPSPRPIPRPEQRKRTGATSTMYLAAMEQVSWYDRLAYNRGVSIPDFDEFIPESVVTGTVRFYTTYVRVDSNDPRDVLKLDTVAPGWTIEESVLRLMKKEARYMNQPKKSIFNVSLYEGYLPVASERVVVDDELKVRTAFDMDLRKNYHLRFGIYNDWNLVDKDALDRIRDDADAVIKIINALDPTLKDRGKLPDVMGGNYIPNLGGVIGELNSNPNLKMGFWTVQTLAVEVTKNAGI